jgi:predicted membrane protein
MEKFSINKFFNNKHAFMALVGLLTILIASWLILYAVPGLLASLFNTILGNIILLVTIILVGVKSIPVAIALIVLFIVLFKFSHYVVKKKEGMKATKKATPKAPTTKVSSAAKVSNTRAKAEKKR